MNGYSGSATERLAPMRRSFDEGFAAPPRLPDEGLEPLLLIRVAGEALALRSLHITGLARIGRVLPVPSRIPELLGITGIRGMVAPVFDLAGLLGFHSGGAQPRWVALTRCETLVALAFDHVEGRAEVPHASLHQYQAFPARDCIQHLVRMEPAVRAVVDIPAVGEAIRRRAGLISSDKE